ncbi:MAG: thiamine phosphate synthase, partial [Planctomycetes bacterium]|nr:thiamine phosphate synthase [Planctomycetota bacterium]
TPSKVGLKEPVGLGELTRRCVASPVPIWGLGGIDASNVSTVLQCGVSGVAVRGAIWNSKRPWRQVCDLRNAMGDFFE